MGSGVPCVSVSPKCLLWAVAQHPDFSSSHSPKQAKRSHSQYPVRGWKHIRGQFSVWLTYCVTAIFNGSFNSMEAEQLSLLWPYCHDEGKLCKQQQKKLYSEPDRLPYVFLGAMVAGPVGNSELRSSRYLRGTVGPKCRLCSKHLWLPAIWTDPCSNFVSTTMLKYPDKKQLRGEKVYLSYNSRFYFSMEQKAKARIQVANHITTTVRSKEK